MLSAVLFIFYILINPNCAKEYTTKIMISNTGDAYLIMNSYSFFLPEFLTISGYFIDNGLCANYPADHNTGT